MPMSSPGSPANTKVPAVDERLVAPESRYEIDDGRLVYVPPADEPHGSRHSKVAALLEAHVTAEFDVAVDMLTRTSETGDQAPDVSVFPRARDPRTRSRRLEELAFEVVATESLGRAADKAGVLASRGVRRIFAIDVARLRAFEWSRELEGWTLLDPSSSIEDPTLAVPLPIEPLARAIKADDAMAKALRAKRHPEFLAERAEGFDEGHARGIEQGIERGIERGRRLALRRLLSIKFGGVGPDLDARIAGATSDELDMYLERLLTAATAVAVFER